MPAPKTQHYTLLVVTDHSQAVRRLRVSRKWLRNGAVGLGVIFLFTLGVFVHYFSLLGTQSENKELKEENANLHARILLVQEKVAHIAATLDRVERYDAKLRTAVSQLQDPEKNLPIGPVGVPEGEGGGAIPGPAPSDADVNALPGRLSSLEGEAARQETSLRELQEYFDDQKSLLASTPSIWPTRGWVTSDFGVRLDPYTAERRMHEGLDIATSVGQAILAPSDGTVVFAGPDGDYGKVLVLDHGYGVKTRYGHLSDIFVHLGDKVKRGSKIAAVGNTGRSTGPHLHYEVRVNGVPDNPRKFILE